MNVLLRGGRIQQVRLAAGLVLVLFAATHFMNHALGLVGLEAMETFQTWRYGITRSWPGTIVLGAAFLTHIGLALHRIAGRQTWRMPLWEALQIGSGVLIPVLLIEHAVTTRGAATLFGTDDYYKPALAYYWPGRALGQTALLVLVWGHACIGLHFWLRLAGWYRAVAPLLLAVAVLLPALALAGFMVAGREVAAEMAVPGAAERLFKAFRWPLGADRLRLDGLSRGGLAIFGALVLGIAGLHLARAWRLARVPMVGVRYTAGPDVEGPIGATLLEISRLRGVPHASVCGGRARCSTCRVRVEAGGETLAAPRFAEAVTLGSVGAPEGVRLACQIRPAMPLTVTRLVAPQGAEIRRIVAGGGDEQGVERKLAVMFLDVRGFTQIADKRLPYDVVFLLNRFFTAIGDAIQAEGGWIDKYMGDGLLAVFGRETGTRAGCRAALAAAARIDLALEQLNGELKAELGAALEIGIGIHAGPVVVGRIGHPETAAITVIGQTVNVAARLEALTKEKGCQLIVSREAVRIAEWPGEGLSAATVAVRGASELIEVLLVPRARVIALA